MLMGEIKVTSMITETLQLKPCIKCGGHDIIIGDCGYSSFNIAYGKCQNKECKHEVTFNCGVNISEKEIVEVWNRENDINLLIEKKQNEIQKIKEEISEFKRLKRKRKL